MEDRSGCCKGSRQFKKRCLNREISVIGPLHPTLLTKKTWSKNTQHKIVPTVFKVTQRGINLTPLPLHFFFN